LAIHDLIDVLPVFTPFLPPVCPHFFRAAGRDIHHFTVKTLYFGFSVTAHLPSKQQKILPISMNPPAKTPPLSNGAALRVFAQNSAAIFDFSRKLTMDFRFSPKCRCALVRASECGRGVCSRPK
jgi:hypothetical protein